MGLALDVESRLFQTMFMEEEGDFSLADGKFRNNYFPGSSPHFTLHGNATASTGGSRIFTASEVRR